MKKLLLAVFFLSLIAPNISVAEGHAYSNYKIGPLLNLELKSKNKSTEPGLARMSNSSEPDLIKVIVTIGEDYLSELPDDIVNELSEKVTSLGGRIGDRAYNNVQVWISSSKLEALSQWSKIKFISTPMATGQNSIRSKGLPYIGATDWQKYGVTGKGVNVAVIDLGFKNFSSLKGTELPTSLKAYYFGTPEHFNSNVHGTACAEIVHDVAPDASLTLLDVNDMEVGFHRAVTWMQNNEIDVVSSSIFTNPGISVRLFYAMAYGIENVPSDQSDSYFSYLDDTFEQVNRIAKQVSLTAKNAVKNNLTWVQAAGNYGQKKWFGRFSDSDGDGFHAFSPDAEFNILNTAGLSGQDVCVALMWGGDENFRSTDDYDLIIVDQNNNYITHSDISQESFPFGLEAVKFMVAPGITSYKIIIKKYSGTPTDLLLLTGLPGLKFYSPEKTVTLNQPAPLAEVITVGAVGMYSDTGEITIAPYSSQGPGENGVIKPDVVAPSGVMTASYGDRAFHGTSAATPHVAGLCALLKQRYPDSTPTQIKNFLRGTALDFGVAGLDNVYGSGMASLPTSVFSQSTLYFPSISSSYGDKNSVGIINIDQSLNLSGQLKAFNSSGHELASKDVSLTKNGRKEFSVDRIYPDVSGISYLAFSYSGGKAQGYVSVETATSDRAYMVPSISNLSPGNMFIPHIASDATWNTEVALLNAGNTTKYITLEFDNGENRNITITPNEQKKFYIRDLFNGIPQPNINSAKILGASGLVGSELFTGGNYAGAISLEPKTEKNIYFPHVANDNYWWTGLVAYNPSVYGVNISVIPFNDSGVELPAKDIFMPGESKYIGTVNSLGLHPETAWFKIESPENIHSLELFATSDGKQMAGYSTVGMRMSSGIFPKINNGDGWTGISLVNPNSTPTTVTILAYNNDGAIVASNRFSLNEYGKVVYTAEKLFSYGNENSNPKSLNDASYIVFFATSEIIGFQINGSASGMMLESIPALSTK